MVFDEAYIAMVKRELAFSDGHSRPWGGGGTWNWVTVADANFIGTFTDWQYTAEGVGDGSDLTFTPGVDANIWSMRVLNEKVDIKVSKRGGMDKNTKGTANDRNPFTLALTDPNAYLAQYGIDPNIIDDAALSGKLDTDDIIPFGGLAGIASGSFPEPASVTILLLGSLVPMLSGLKRKRKP